MNLKAKFGKFRSKLRCIVSSVSRDCSTCQFQYASLSELEFHNKKNELILCQVQKNKFGKIFFILQFSISSVSFVKIKISLSELCVAFIFMIVGKPATDQAFITCIGNIKNVRRFISGYPIILFIK